MIERSTHWGALLFTFLVGGMIVAAVPVLRDLEGSPLAVPARPQATVAPTQAAATPPAVTAPAAEDLGARFLRKTASPVIFRDQVTTIALLFENTGEVPWVKSTAAEARLGIVGEDTELADLGMAVEWPLPTRPAVQSELVVQPGGIAQFDFRVKGADPGTYRFQVAPVVDGVAWMEVEPVFVEVRVR